MVTVVARNDMDEPGHWTDAPDYSPEEWRTGRGEHLPAAGAPKGEGGDGTTRGEGQGGAGDAHPGPADDGDLPTAPATDDGSDSDRPADPEYDGNVRADTEDDGDVTAAATTADPGEAALPDPAPTASEPDAEHSLPQPAATGARPAGAADPDPATPPPPAEPAGAPARRIGWAADRELSGERLVRRTARERFRVGLRRAPAHVPDALRTPLLRSHRIAVLSLKGGVSKTTTTLALGAVLARERADRVVAVDANPDSGTLGRRVPRQSGATVRDLVTAIPGLRTYMDIRAFTSQAPSGLEVIANDSDPAVSQIFGDQDYRRVVELLSGHYPIVLTDSGTGMLHDTMRGILDLSDQLVVAATPSVDGASSASVTFDWLAAHGYEEKAREAVTVVSGVRSSSGRLIRVDEVVAHFRQRCRAVVSVPYDPYLARGGEVDPEWMRGRTRAAYYELASLVAQEFDRG
ncbi:hypothetical protein GCM10010363_28930 [Streptomyces omiyaensis]|nr:hypothetical protein GCM10010363_28930 [Streptomyces omiyaensis]